MEKLKLYLDNCCFNRPYDDQEDFRIKIETEAKLIVQEKIKNNEFDLAWSYILDYENKQNPFEERKQEIIKWKNIAKYDILENENILNYMKKLVEYGIKPLDALHIGCAIDLKCEYFLTVDMGILKKRDLVKNIEIINPIDFIYLITEANK